MRNKLTIISILTIAVSVILMAACDGAAENKSEQKAELKTTPSTQEQTQDQAQKALPPAKFQQAQMRDAFSGKMIDRNVYLDYQGKRVYFCCTKSRDDFKTDPNKYMDEFDRQGVILADAPKGK